MGKYKYEKVSRGIHKIINKNSKNPFFVFCHINQEQVDRLLQLSAHTGFTPDRIIAFATMSHVDTELAKLAAGEGITTKDTVPPKEDQSAQ